MTRRLSKSGPLPPKPPLLMPADAETPPKEAHTAELWAYLHKQEAWLGAQELPGVEGLYLPIRDKADVFAAGCVYLSDREVHLTPIEYRLLCLLEKNTGRVLTHNYILKELRGSTLASDTPSLRAFMATLHKKIEPVRSDAQHPDPHRRGIPDAAHRRRLRALLTVLSTHRRRKGPYPCLKPHPPQNRSILTIPSRTA